ncbi:MAG: sigma-70 family RNA polymerase sigma factor [Spirochaetales bacterium]|jgi:RNA polymerase primary sigma factor|nr:RNA polymerase sigma factor RpoD/SigA [Exilispira sp.]NMC67954.1 sigma-70 family RNA polymerase sigma factor [Spirochaetales bacterium]
MSNSESFFFNNNKEDSFLEYEIEEEEKKIIQDESILNDVFSLYFKEVNHYDLLTSDEEVVFFKRLRDKEKELTFLFDKFKKVIDLKEKRRIKTAIFEIENEIDCIKNKIVVSNLRLVVSVAKRFQNKYISLIDLINEGNIGLLEAIDKFDYRKGNKFSTYALYWIKQAITKTLSDKARIIRIPNYLNNLLNKINEYIDFYTKTYGVNPSISLLSEEFCIPEKKLKQILELNKEINFLEEPIQMDSNSVIGDYIASNSLEEEILDEYQRQWMKHSLQLAFSKLTPREKLVLELRYGLKGNKSYTLEETGKMLSLTRERIRQIQNNGLNKIKQCIEAEIKI